jgi:hypothetical protein
MHNFKLTAVAAAFCLAMSTGAIAGTMSKTEYKSAKADIAAAFVADKVACKPLTANALDICIVAATGRQNVATAELELKNATFKNKVTGTGGSDAQMDAIQRAYEGAKTNAEKVNAIRMLDSELNRREGLAKASLNDDQKVLLNERLGREGITDMPSSVKRSEKVTK